MIYSNVTSYSQDQPGRSTNLATSNSDHHGATSTLELAARRGSRGGELLQIECRSEVVVVVAELRRLKSMLLLCLLQLLEQLDDEKVDNEEKKAIVFALQKTKLRAAQFAEEFILQDGLPALLRIICDPDNEGSGLQGHALQALRQVPTLAG